MMTNAEAANVLSKMRCEHIDVIRQQAIDRAICCLTADKKKCPKGHDTSKTCYEFCAFRENMCCTLND